MTSFFRVFSSIISFRTFCVGERGGSAGVGFGLVRRSAASFAAFRRRVSSASCAIARLAAFSSASLILFEAEAEEVAGRTVKQEYEVLGDAEIHAHASCCLLARSLTVQSYTVSPGIPAREAYRYSDDG